MWGLWALLVGLSVGSFINVAADRLPQGRSLVKPRSFCDTCNRPLASRDMVPVLSYLWLKGRCRYCGASIPVRVMLTEAATGLLFVILYIKFGFGIEFVVACAIVTLLLVVTIIDLEHRLILDRVIFPSMVALLLLASLWPLLGDPRFFLGDLPRFFLGDPGLLDSFLNSVAAGFGAFLVFLVIYLIYPPGMGFGDVKLAGLLGLMVGFPGILVALWIASIAGGLVAIALMLLRKKGRKDAIPFGPYLAGGGLIAFLAGSELMAKYQELAVKLLGSGT